MALQCCRAICCQWDSYSFIGRMTVHPRLSGTPSNSSYNSTCFYSPKYPSLLINYRITWFVSDLVVVFGELSYTWWSENSQGCVWSSGSHSPPAPHSSAQYLAGPFSLKTRVHQLWDRLLQNASVISASSSSLFFLHRTFSGTWPLGLIWHLIKKKTF